MTLTVIPKSLFWLLCSLVALMSVRFLVLDVEITAEFVAHHARLRPVAFYGHVGLATVALALMPFQFWARLRTRRRSLHRWMGRIYAVSVLLAGLGGISMAIGTAAGPVAAWGFGLLGVFWIAVTARAVWLAIKGRIAEHRVWMIRSAALTFAAVTLRIYLPLSEVSGLPFDASYSAIAWMCWVPNLMAAELWLREQRPASRAVVV